MVVPFASIAAFSTESAGGNVVIDVDSGVYGHRVTMADLDTSGLDRFRRMAGIVGFPDDPPRVMTALALSGSAAQARVQRFPADADFFERVHITADTRDEACGILGEVMRDKVLATMVGDGHRLQEVKLGSWPEDGEVDGDSIRRGTPVSWTPEQVEAGGITYTTTDGAERLLRWDDAALDPGWCKLDWVIEDPLDRRLVNASNMLDVTWEAPDGTVTPLDGYGQEATSAGRSADLEDARTGAMREVDAYFKRALDSVPSIKAFLDDLAANPH